jgi:hypothetical protein
MENEIPAGSRASNLYWTRTEQLRSRRSDSGPDVWRLHFEFVEPDTGWKPMLRCAGGLLTTVFEI